MAAPIPSEAVPLNIWPCAQVPLRQQWVKAGYAPGSGAFSAALFPALAQRIVATYSRPGDLVIETPAGSGVAAVEAARLHRRAVAVAPTEALEALVSANARLALTRGGRAELVTVVRGDPEAATETVPGSIGAASLVLTSLSRRRPDTSRLRWEMAAVVHEAAALLAPGGFLAVACRSAHVRERLIDTTAVVVVDAERSGLLYLQHVIAITAGIRGGELLAMGRALGRGRHVVTHTDVLVFMKPTPELRG